jgi:hypothetical protein
MDQVAVASHNCRTGISRGYKIPTFRRILGRRVVGRTFHQWRIQSRRGMHLRSTCPRGNRLW